MDPKKLLDGIPSDLLSKFKIVQNAALPAASKPVEVKSRFVPNKKQAPKNTSTTFAGMLKEDTKWLYEKLQHDKKFTTHKITVSLIKKLMKDSFPFVIGSFKYQNSEMDVASIYQDIFTEYEIKTCRSDYADKEFKKCVWKGRPVNKHGLIRAGEWIANRFYFVCPENLIDIDHLPEYAGLIYFIDQGPNKIYKFIEVKPAPWLHQRKLPTGFYKTLATSCYNRWINIVKQNQVRSLHNILEDEEAENYIEPNSTNTHQDHAK